MGKKKQIIKKVPVSKLPDINLTPTANWMITTALIEPEASSIIVHGDKKPTFLEMQQVLAVGPQVEFAKVGDWVYIDMTRFIKTVKKKSTIRAGVGGEDMISEQLQPPVWVGPFDPTTRFKISDREIEGIIKDPYSAKREYDTLEAYMERKEKEMEEVRLAKEKAEKERMEAQAKLAQDSRQGPVIRTSTSPALND